MEIYKIDKSWIKYLWKTLKRKEGFAGFSGEIKPKEKAGEVLDESSIRFYVTKKKPLNKLGKKDLMPKTVAGVKTDIKEIGEICSLPSPFRPAKSGYSGMAFYPQATACTVGGFARDLTDGEFVSFSNNHCTSNENKLPAGTPYVCPSPMDGGTLNDKLGELKRFVPIIFDEYECIFRNAFGLRGYLSSHLKDYGILQQQWNQVDLGIINKIDQAQISLEIDQIGLLNGKRRGVLGEIAHKTGRTTGYTEGATLIDNDWFGNIGYSRGTAPFGPCGLLDGSGFSAGGDSSSLIPWKIDNCLGGELFAGSSTNTIFTHYDLMEAVGQIEILY